MAPDKDPRPESVHAGHRKRVRDRLLAYGGEQMDDYQLVELLLFYTHPRGDVNPLAHRLIDRFGNLKGLLDASPEEVTKVVGVGDHSAALFRLCYEVMLRYQRTCAQRGEVIFSTEEAGDYLTPYFLGAREELVYLLSVDSKGKLLSCDRVSQGAADAVLLNQRRVVERAIASRASVIYLAHCHLSGLAMPSREDLWATRRLMQALEPLNIRLGDHLIFADGDYVSMAQSGLLRAWNDPEGEELAKSFDMEHPF